MGRRLLASLTTTAAVAASLLIGSAGSATAAGATADTPAESASAAVSRGGGVTPNAKLPREIQVTEPGLKIVATLRGVGTQVYDCTPGNPPTFREPVAGLFTLRGTPAGIHGKGPFWTNFDGSRVEGSVAASAQPKNSSPNDVPWLKLNAKSAGASGVFNNVTVIQRIDTRGGQPPANCGDKQTVAVNYTANYVFWGK